MIRNNIIIFSVVLSAVLAASSAFAGKETTSDALKNSEKRAEKEYKNIHKESEVHKGSKHRYRSTHNIAGQTQQKWKIYSQDGLCVLKLEPFKKMVHHDSKRTPYLSIVYLGSNMYQIYTYLSYQLGDAASIAIGNNNYLLHTSYDYFAATYNSMNDVSIINDMIDNQGVLEVRAHDSSGELSVDLYDIGNSTNMLLQLQERCSGYGLESQEWEGEAKGEVKIPGQAKLPH